MMPRYLIWPSCREQGEEFKWLEETLAFLLRMSVPDENSTASIFVHRFK